MASNPSRSRSLPEQSPSIGRQSSAWIAEQSENILGAVESGDHAEVRKSLRSPEGDLAQVLLAASTSSSRDMRTPLMAAAASSDLSLFATVVHAVDACIDRQPELPRRAELWREQMQLADVSGITLLMLAARSGNVGILEEVVKRARKAQDAARLVDRDHRGTTVLMHAASTGSPAVFNKIIEEIGEAWPAKAVEEQQLLATSFDGRTVLMHAARCSDQLGVLCVAHACKTFLHPSKMRRLIEKVDDEEMTFLMHAVSGGCHHRGTSTSTPGDAAPGERPSAGAPMPTDDGDAAELGAAGPPAPAAAAPADVGAKDSGVVVFKTAWWLVQEVLWKEQVREQLKATDAWGRSLLTHAVLSARVTIFDAVFYAAREMILDDEVDVLLGINENDGSETAMEEALAKAPKAMAARVVSRDQELKKAVAFQERASTIEAKIQSFIPGKLIVIFQLLLPEVGSSNRTDLTLLLAMSAIAPFLSWASSLVAREKPSSNERRRSAISLFLSAPAMFFWGLGTSNIAQDPDGMGWSASTSAAALAVATIVIPAIDAFFSSKKVEQFCDKWSCQRWRFIRRAWAGWSREQATRKAAAAAAAADVGDNAPKKPPYGVSTPLPTKPSSQKTSDWVTLAQTAEEEEEEEEEKEEEKEDAKKEEKKL